MDKIEIFIAMNLQRFYSSSEHDNEEGDVELDEEVLLRSLETDLGLMGGRPVALANADPGEGDGDWAGHRHRCRPCAAGQAIGQVIDIDVDRELVARLVLVCPL